MDQSRLDHLGMTALRNMVLSRNADIQKLMDEITGMLARIFPQDPHPITQQQRTGVRQ